MKVKNKALAIMLFFALGKMGSYYIFFCFAKKPSLILFGFVSWLCFMLCLFILLFCFGWTLLKLSFFFLNLVEFSLALAAVDDTTNSLALAAVHGTTNAVIGIDMGTTYSRVGLYRDGHVEIIANDQGNRFTPSWIAFTDTERLIGEAAKNQAALDPERTIFDVNRLIGKR